MELGYYHNRCRDATAEIVYCHHRHRSRGMWNNPKIVYLPRQVIFFVAISANLAIATLRTRIFHPTVAFPT
jgi:hypothetical protein